MIACLNDGKILALDFRETAPAGSYKDMYLDKAGNPVTQLSLYGPLASGIPGTVAGLFTSMKYAKLSFKTLIAPAIELAEKGFSITASQAHSFNENKSLFEKLNKNKVAFVNDILWKEGDLLIQPALAQTLKRIRSKGAKGFYQGLTAKLIVKAARACLKTHV